MFSRFFILHPSKDTVIHNYYTDSNSGKSYSLSLIHNHDGDTDSSKYSRVLLDFDFDSLIDFFGIESLTSNSFTATLFLTNLKYDEYNHPLEYNIDLFALTSNWAEGFVSSDDFDESGYCNWDYRYNGALWSTSGGDFLESVSSTVELVDGTEDVSFDITNYLSLYLNAKLGLTGNPSELSTTSDFNGFLLKFRDESLSSFNEYKRFYASSTHTIYDPKILVSVEKPQIYDNRSRFITNINQTIYFPYRLDGKFVSTNIDSSDIVFSVLENGVTLTSLTANVVETRDNLFNVTFNIPDSLYNETSIYQDVWSITSLNKSITGRFDVVSESDVVGLDYISLTSNFNRNYVSHGLLGDVGVVTQYNNRMLFGSREILRFFPYMKSNTGVDNIGAVFGNELIYPSEFYVKIIDAESNYDWTDWIKLDLLGDSYKLEIDTSSFREGVLLTFNYKIKIWDTYKIIESENKDICSIVDY